MTVAPRILGGCIAAMALLLPGLSASQDAAAETRLRVEAAFLRNFARYVTWPGTAFADARTSWHVCILGRDPFGDILEKTFQGRSEQGRAFEVFRAETPDGLPSCQMAYIAYHDAVRRRAALAAMKDQPVLTVGEAREFLSEGGMIRFQVGERVEMGINLDRTRSASLLVQTKMLEVSSEVLENGNLRVRK